MAQIIIYYWPNIELQAAIQLMVRELCTLTHAEAILNSVRWHVFIFFLERESCGKWYDHLGEREWNKLMYSDCRGRLQHIRAKCRENRACRITSNAENKATVYFMLTDMPARTRTWSSSHFYSRYITVNLRLKYVWFSGYPTLPSLLSILKDFPVRQYAQAACDTEGTSIILCVCSFLEHSSDPSMKSTCAEPHMSW